jgi:hypothetical protein
MKGPEDRAVLVAGGARQPGMRGSGRPTATGSVNFPGLSFLRSGRGLRASRALRRVDESTPGTPPVTPWASPGTGRGVCSTATRSASTSKTRAALRRTTAYVQSLSTEPKGVPLTPKQPTGGDAVHTRYTPRIYWAADVGYEVG